MTDKPEGLRLAFSGSRELYGKHARLLVRAALRRCPWRVARIHHGDAKGIDEAVAQVCDEIGVEHLEYIANWEEHGKSAGVIRNNEMLLESDALIAIRLNGSPGTSDAIRRANRYNLEKMVIDINDG